MLVGFVLLVIVYFENRSNYYYRKYGTSHRHLDTTRPYHWSGSTITGILDNMVYLGHMPGLRNTSISYKNKKHILRPESEQVLVENTHEPLVTQERQFAQYINQKYSVELRREMNVLQKELDAMQKRNGDLSILFKRLYEDHALGRVTEEQFRMLSSDYNTEQKQLENAIPEKESRLEKLKASAANVDTFIEKAKRYTAIDELTPELLRLFIQRIEVGERSKKYSRSGSQSVRIIYRDIGSMDRPMESKVLQPQDRSEAVDNSVRIPA